METGTISGGESQYLSLDLAWYKAKLTNMNETGKAMIETAVKSKSKNTEIDLIITVCISFFTDREPLVTSASTVSKFID